MNRIEERQVLFNPLLPKRVLYILLCQTPDDFTRQREAPWAVKG